MCNIILIIVIFDIKSIISIIIIRWYLVCAYENKKGRLPDESFLVRPIFDAPRTANSQSLTGELPRVSPDKVDPRASYVSHINIFEEPVLFEHRRHHSSWFTLQLRYYDCTILIWRAGTFWAPAPPRILIHIWHITIDCTILIWRAGTFWAPAPPLPSGTAWAPHKSEYLPVVEGGE